VCYTERLQGADDALWRDRGPEMSRVRWSVAVAVTAVLAGGLAACGGDDAAASEEACDAYIGVTKAFNAEEPDPDAIRGLLDDVEAEAPEDIEDPLQVMVDTGREVLETQDFEAFQTDEFMTAQGEVDPFFFENCDADQKAEVTAVDYEFQDAPDEVDAGEVAFLFENGGEEVHEMVLLRKKDGTTESFDEILALPEEEGQQLVEPTFVAFGFPDAKTASWVDLDAGEYSMVCFIPEGSTLDAGEEGGDGPPHFTLGMRQDFVVG
jgi:hypothetical protein